MDVFKGFLKPFVETVLIALFYVLAVVGIAVALALSLPVALVILIVEDVRG